MQKSERSVTPDHGFCACSYTIENKINRKPYFASKMPVFNQSQKSHGMTFHSDIANNFL